MADMPVTYRDQGQALFSLNVPDFWTASAGGQRTVTASETGEARLINRVISLQPKTEPRVWVGFMSPNGIRTRDEAISYLSDIGAFIVRDPVLTDQKRISVGGRPAERFSGTGRRNGRGVNFTALLIALPGNRVAVSISVIEDGADPELVNDINAIYASFRAVN
ncbi:hypothetical protein [Primorskyibacter sp. S87]|uniref:hypothetical protein n=1 Tax=Primorskyibacter sp. S87 TaxID=3415126 RepID=UPI003C7D077F